MIEQIKKLTQAEREILFKAPILVSVLAASWDHEISNREEADAIEFVHIKTFSAAPLLIDYYKEVSNDFKKHFETTVKKYAPFDDAKREALKKEISRLNNVIAKLDKEFAKTLHKSLAAYAEHVKKAYKKGLLMNFVFPVPIRGFTD